MLYITNQQVSALITERDARAAMRTAFAGMAAGAQQARVRCAADGVTLSSMGAVIPALGVSGIKAYTTIKGQFRFLITLFSNADGRPLAVIEGDSMTGLRTAAATALAVEELARPDARTLSILGTGVQAAAHVAALTQVHRFDRILVAGLPPTAPFAAQMRAVSGLPVDEVTLREAVQRGEVIVCATRASEPIVFGADLAPGTLVAAIGSSKPDCRELDDEALGRAATIVVEWKEQARREAGDLLLCRPGTFDWDRVLELGDLLAPGPVRQRLPEDIVVYKAVGIGMEDIALAALAYQRQLTAGN